MKHINAYIQALILVIIVFSGICRADGGYSKMLVVGNSITQHDPAAWLYWTWNWGMAASSQSNDFVHRLWGRLQADQSGVTLELQIAHISDETNTMSGYSHLLSTGADLIIFELGDNYRGELSYDALQAPYEQMIMDISAGGNNPDVFVCSTWGSGDLRNSYIQAAAVNQGATFVDISYLSEDWHNMAIAESYCRLEWVGNGVDWHPGDRGMKLISDNLYDAITLPEPGSLAILCTAVVGMFVRNKR